MNDTCACWIGISFKKIHLYLIQILLSAVGLAATLWGGVDYLKRYIMADPYRGVAEWVYLFYHPYQSGLLNYIFLCVGLGVCGWVIYLFLPRLRLERKVESVDPRLFYAFLSLSVLALFFVLSFWGSLAATVPAFFLFVVPFLYLVEIRVFRRVLPVLILLVSILVSIEPIRIFIGPTYLMNEYLEIPSETLVGDRYVRNLDFLAHFKSIAVPTSDWFLNKAEVVDSEYCGKVGLHEISAPDGVRDVVRERCRFINNNSLEYKHQLFNRGQINHIGHVLNPLNEYLAGKPLADIYMQYGVGNTFLMKWTMELFGGVSFDGFHKCYIFYVVYFFVFLFFLFYLFRQNFYVFCGFAVVAVSFFVKNFIALILAPGFIPTIHLFDVFVLISLTAFFCRGQNTAFLVLAFILSALGILTNFQFGGVLVLSLTLTSVLFALENKSARSRFYWLSIISVVFCVVIVGGKSLSTHQLNAGFDAYLSGFFSWKPDTRIVMFTFVYIILSYLFLGLLRDIRHGLKYMYVFTLFYTQGLFVYFYWSGQMNHLPMVLPSLGLQALLVLFMLEKRVLDFPLARDVIYSIKPLALILAFCAILSTSAFFYFNAFGQRAFYDNFQSHKTYAVNLERAKIVTTINPVYLTESLSLLDKYIPKNEKRMVLLSKYDNLLPFLNARYNNLPFFEMAWYLTNVEKLRQTVNILKDSQPEYIFVDTDINDKMIDPWATVFSPLWLAHERKSRAGRLEELRKVFHAVAPYYRLVEKGTIISVYRRV